MKMLKDPQATLDYSVEWSQWLDGDTISTSSWTVTTGLNNTSESTTTTKATVWLSGGSIGGVYSAVNTITTATGRTDERTITITVVNK